MSFRRKKKSDFEEVAKPVNQKIKNATKVTAFGIEFDSKLELYTYEELHKASIPFTFKPTFILVEKFVYRSESIRAMTLTSDFDLYTHDVIVDSKGYANDNTPLKYKLLKTVLLKDGREPRIVMPSSQKQVREVISKIQNGFFLDLNDPKQALSDNQINERCKRLKKHLRFDGNNFTLFTGEIIYSMSLIEKLEKHDFNVLLTNLPDLIAAKQQTKLF